MEYCYRCERYFGSWSALKQHERNSSEHHICYTCEIDFSTRIGLKEHWVQSPQHAYCQYCDEHFSHDDDLEDHNESSHPWCRTCNKVFKDDYGLSEHYRQSPVHHYCAECKRDFQSQNNLNNHLNSSIHQSRNVRCPFPRCGQAFIARSHLILHLESGRCPSGVDRATVNDYVRRYDKTNIITDPSRLITGPGGSSPMQQIHYTATRAAYNGHAYECYLCHNQYKSTHALEQHMNSPRHQNQMYLCPLNTCRQRFTALSALCQHIESEKCGVVKFKTVQNALNDMIGMKMLTMR